MLPESFANWSNEQLKAVLLHELAHTSRMDPLAQTIGQMATVIGWFHPLVWLMSGRLRRDAESAADDLVLANGTTPSLYAELLMNLGAGRSIGFSGATAMASPPLTNRIRHIVAENCSRKKRSGKFSLVIAVCFACVLIPIATIQNLSAVAPDETTTGSDSQSPEPIPAKSTPAVEYQSKSNETYEREQQNLTDRLRQLPTLMSAEIVADFKTIEPGFRAILRNGMNRRDQARLNILRSGLKYRVFILSDPDVQKDSGRFSDANRTLQRLLAAAGSPALIADPVQRSQFRELLCKETIALLEQLFHEGNFSARAAALQRMLDLTVEPTGKQQPRRIFAEVDEFYIHVLQDAEQPDTVKQLTANSLRIYLEETNPVPAVEIGIANTVANELRRPFLSSPYMLSLLSTLEEIRAPRELVGRNIPIAYCSLAEVMSNRDFDIKVRCAAARASGRMGWDNRLQLDALALATSELVMETALLFNASDDQNNPKWARCGWSLYTAFHHENAKEAQGAPPFFPKGFLNRDPDSEVVQEAYENSVRIIAKLMMEHEEIPVDVLERLSTWMQANKSIDRKFDPACAPVPQMSGLAL